MDISKELTMFFQERNISQKELAEGLGVSAAYISRLLAGKQNFGKKQAEKFRDLFGLSPAWLMTGEGSMLADGSPEKDKAPREEPLTVPLLPVFAQAGSLIDWSDGIEENKCERVVSPVSGIDMAVHIYGESMYPDIPNGSVVYVKRVDPDAFIDWGKSYILDTVNGPLLKYVAPGHDDGFVKCISANHDPMYAPFEVSKSDIIGMWRVVMCMSMK